MIDIINHPSHYKAANGIETINVIEGFTDPVAWSMGNVIKYICRWRHKNGLEQASKDGRWRCSRYPFIIVCASEEFCEKIWNIFRQYPITVPFMVGYTTQKGVKS